MATTTHDWASTVDADHLVAIRARAQDLAPSGALHLLLEVLAYAADEASVCGRGSCRVTLHRDCWVSVADDGRGTDTRFDERGQPVKRPVMSTPDVSFLEASDPPLLPEGDPRRGMSVVAALSAWLLHGNRRSDGAWTQRYRYGVPDTDLRPSRPTTAPVPRSTSCLDRSVRPCCEVGVVLTDWRDLAVELTDAR